MFKIPQTKLQHFSDWPGQELHLPARHTPPPPPPPPPHPAAGGFLDSLAPRRNWTAIKTLFRRTGLMCRVAVSSAFPGRIADLLKNWNLFCRIPSFVCDSTHCAHPKCHVPCTSISANAASWFHHLAPRWRSEELHRGMRGSGGIAQKDLCCCFDSCCFDTTWSDSWGKCSNHTQFYSSIAYVI